VEFRILGPLEVTARGRSLDVGGARTRAVLAMLLVHANQVVSADRLVEELWAGHPADKATASLQVRLSELRRVLRSAGEAGRLATRTPGYLLQVKPGESDAMRFEQLAAGAEAALAAGETVAAAQRLDEALALWHGPALADVALAASVRAEAGRLEEKRLAAQESRAEALLGCGRHRELIAELEALTTAHPLRERLWFQRMLALYRAGRQADALRAYRELRAILVGELGIEPGPELRDLHARILRQDPGLVLRQDPGLVLRQDPGLDGPGRSRRDAEPEPPPPTGYVRCDDGVHLAYQVLGHGERDIVVVPGLMSHLDLQWEDREAAGFYRRLATLGRLIMFDKRDTGLSDRSPGDSPLEERMDDVRTVMRAAGSSRAVLFGYSEGAPMSILFAATYPECVSGLILGSASARWFPAPGYPCGQEAEEMYDALVQIVTHRWGEGASIEWYLQSRADSPRAREAWGRFERMAISPSAFLRMVRMIRDIDVRAVLPAIHVPTLVIQRQDDRITPPAHGRYLASHIAGARYFEQPGDHVLRFASPQDIDAMCAEIADFLAGADRPWAPDRVLATILLVTVAAPGADRPGPPDVATARQQVGSHRGRLISSTGASILATFDAPGQAIRCAAAVRDHAAARGAWIRAGIHTGEVDLAGDGIAGASVDITRQVAALAQPGEILVSRTVTDLVAGSGITFTARGRHPVADSAGDWPLFAVAALPGVR
jgi:DNA-binding SARP family transcriptional activator/pimeloyl-ACP methyl ester carboxylesterase